MIEIIGEPRRGNVDKNNLYSQGVYLNVGILGVSEPL